MNLKIDTSIGFLRIGLVFFFFFTLSLSLWGSEYIDIQNDTDQPKTYSQAIYPLWKSAELLEDSSGKLDINDVITESGFDSLNNHPQLGQSDSHFWIKFKVDRILFDTLDTSYVIIANPIIDNLELYRYSPTNSYKLLYRFGDTQAYSARPIDNQDFLIPLDGHSEGDIYYLRVWGKSPMMLPSYISNEIGLIEKSNTDTAFAFFISGIILSMVLYNLFLYFGTRIPVFGWYVIYVGNVYAYTLFTSGIGFRYLWSFSSEVQGFIAYLFIGCFQWASFKFTRSFLKVNQFFPKVDKFLFWISFIPVVSLFFILIDVSISIKILSFTTLIITVTIPVVSLMILKKGFVPSVYFLTSWMFLIIGMSVYNLTLLAFLPINFFTMHAIELGVASESILLSFALAHRIKSMKQEKEFEELKAREALEKAYLETESALSLAKASNQAKNAFLNNISHNVKTPIHAFYGNIELLFNSNLDDQQKERLESAKDNAMQLFYYMDNLLTYSEILGNDIVPLETKANIENEITEIVETWQKNYDDREILISTSFDSSLPSTIFCEWVHVRKVLRVIFDSLIVRSKTTSLTLSVTGQMEDVEGSIVVSLIGLDIDEVQVINNWVKEEISANEWEGLGLEYYVGRKLIEVIGARLIYVADKTDGMRIDFEFPGRLAKDEYSSESRSSFPNVNVLVVDDNKVNIQVMCAMLSKLGASTEFAMSGEDALEKITSGDYDIILMDCLMPGLSGQETAQKIRQIHSSNQNCPIIAVSANASDKDRDSCLKSGMNDFMSKPVRLEKLAKFLTRWVPEY